MDPSLKSEEPCSTPPPYFLPVESEQGDNVMIYSPFNHGPPPTPKDGCNYISHTPLPIPGRANPPRQWLVQHYESKLGDSPGLIRCPSCQSQVMSDVTHHAGTFSWTMCLVFILCGLFLGCCLIPFSSGISRTPITPALAVTWSFTSTGRAAAPRPLTPPP
ncbi:lipopolysaccharide-induced tumor necrosis factor-alpha factor homolog [Coregonus clupeaformis]|uniref:lipopolysaccharide-induced tumor necrosis factor-alpha factor homolog n=1 Tax=Coregonus clupeaformis TaxID=59861 RepID=UPI001E1C6F09|nr:lipopolysaccharide-induced tumor necrosis factor-alpha factor homolog [Coregonus clupeaformis]